MEGENEYEMITLDNQSFDVPSSDKPQNPSGSEKQVPSRDEPQNPSGSEKQVPSRDEPQNPSRSEKQVPSRDEPQNLSGSEKRVPSRDEPQNPSGSKKRVPSRDEPQNPLAYEDLESQYKMPACSWMCFILLVGFILVGSAAFISLGLTSWNINSNLRTQTMGLQASNVAELERRLAQLQVSVNNNTLECDKKILEVRNDSTSELERRLAQLQDSVNNNTSERERRIMELRNDTTSELERRLTHFQIFENNRDDIQNRNILLLVRSLTGLASSCSAIFAVYPSSPSGHYWIEPSNGSAVHVYCDMTRSCGNITGGWMRVASLDWSNESLPCPDGFRERSDSGNRTCGINSRTGSCPSLIFKTYNTSYSRVCGKINGYQVGTPDAFSTIHGRGSNITIDSNYVDGVSLTHGGNPRRHIWTFVAAHDDMLSMTWVPSICQCVLPSGRSTMAPPLFVGMDYFCDTGCRMEAQIRQFYPDDPLWNGVGCASTSTCCSFNNPPWFNKQLPSATTDDIEMRVCRDESRDNEDIAISNVEIYVQ